MADSGAEVSLVTEDWYSDHLLPRKVPVRKINRQITDAGGATISCLG